MNFFLRSAIVLIWDFIDKANTLLREDYKEQSIPDVLYVLKHGYHEKRKTSFDEKFQTWKYAVRGKTLDDIDIRVIIAFDDTGIMIITVMQVEKG